MHYNYIFITNDRNLNRGSYRIWVRDLSDSLNALGKSVKVVDLNQIALSDSYYKNIIIFDKSIDPSILKNESKNSLVGAINPPNTIKYEVDFVVVGSREEETSLARFYDNIILLPLIENSFYNCNLKKHENHNTIRILYHGNALHLSSFKSNGLKLALERYKQYMRKKDKEIILLVVTGEKNPRWIVGKPNINCKFIKYDHSIINDIFYSCDICVVPGAYVNRPVISIIDRILSNIKKSLFHFEYNHKDFRLRFKNKANHGRAMVPMQLGIPVIADITPSHFELLGDPLHGFIASCEYSWYRGLVALEQPALRNQIAKHAKLFIQNKYDPLKWARYFSESIEKLLAKN
mgnify:CR=1 FL=1